MAEGLCRQTGVPHKGWTWVHAYDSCDDGEDLHRLCEWCGHTLIRYVHEVSHPKYHRSIEVGEYCADTLGLAYVAGPVEKRMRSRSRRRANWLARKGWRFGSKPGSEWIKVDGIPMGVFVASSGRWSYWLENDGSKTWGPRRGYESSDSAKLAVFDVFMGALDARERGQS